MGLDQLMICFEHETCPKLGIQGARFFLIVAFGAPKAQLKSELNDLLSLSCR